MIALMQWRRAQGFTLLEMLVTVALAGILAGVALASWHRHVARGWRAHVQIEMIVAMLALQQHAVATGSYAQVHGEGAAGEWPQWVPAPPQRPHHRIVAAPCTGQALRHCVELRAVPEQPDLACGTLILRSTGEWLAAPDASGAPVALPGGC